MKTLFTPILLLALAATPALAQNTLGNSSAAPRRAASGSGTLKTKSTAKAGKAREKELQRETRTVQRQHERTESHIEAQNKTRIKEAHKQAGVETR
jgi:hypothetical protein